MHDFDFITEIEGNSKRKINISIDDMNVNYSYTKEKRDLIANDYWIFKKFPGLTNYFGSSIRSYNGITTNKSSESTFMQNLLTPLKGIGSITTVAAAVGGCIGLMTSPISVIPIILTTMTCLKVQQDVRLTSKKVKLDTENMLLSSFMYEKIFQASILN
ncbi:hypothetical protein fh0823_25790 [Francisella halioticida]|uniref:Uncharacterized protein n=1 Tax=Francisella halioticida TaxID=549298 RepID=A0ABM6LXA4_9GAMM|nr:hypothetical protein [Francisella halioticida]ASG67284.1 hypothetical protein CDV26_01770 [Francisella halioticida]BCD92440.1 hypothetical protein fh0823_25790 [Francisella halioticida]